MLRYRSNCVVLSILIQQLTFMRKETNGGTGMVIISKEITGSTRKKLSQIFVLSTTRIIISPNNS